jgi:hypothetical protein
MPDLSNTVRWVEYAPDLLGNREAEKPFVFLLNGSMSKEQMRALKDALAQPVGPPEPPKDATDEQRAAYDAEVTKAIVKREADAVFPFVKFGDEPLTVDGKPITTVRDYLDFVATHLVGLGPLLEVRQALVEANTMGARVGFFSGRSSGGGTSTGRSRSKGQSAAR